MVVRAWIQHQNRKEGDVDVWTLGFDTESGEQIISGKLFEYLETLGFSNGIREFDTQEELIECLQKLCKKLQELLFSILDLVYIFAFDLYQ